ncbi:hypothetical protein GT348_05240 [Aristophania vespae]|uniref:Uncharacterized protein n=1 Tax=Aristophania vespae TaxID=2697033 RepID=A0A6P1NHP6_9PROT|nr:hypothetical protein GT348_05240 [Aristophania vespae]
MSRLVILVPLLLIMFFMARNGVLDTIYDQITFKKTSWFDNSALVEHLRTVIRDQKLSTLPRKCLVFVINGDSSNNEPIINVLGRHGNGCPGTEASAEDLFKIKVNRLARYIATDAGSPGNFRPLISR